MESIRYFSWRLVRQVSAALLLSLLGVGASAQILLDPRPFPRPIPIPLPNPEDFVSITAGDYHTCVSKLNGNTYCWGLNHLGQVGIGSSRTCSGYNCVDRPRIVMGAVKQVDAGRDHTCAMDTSGVVKCWGVSNYGQLGAGVYGDSSTTGPQTVPGHVFTSISAGQSSTCGTSTAGMFCWGKIVNSTYGTPNPTLIFGWNGYQNVSVGHQHACAVYIVGSWREADCWGYNNYGQTGIDPAWFLNVPATLLSSLGTSVSRVSTQADYTCGDQTNGTVQCMGVNGWGQLGNGATGYTPVFQAQNVGGGMMLAGVSTGPNHACALGTNGAAYCWGNGYAGQVGVASGVYTTPQTVSGGKTFRAVAAGMYHTCGIGTDNRIYCWGWNNYGQLGTMYPGGWVTSPVQTLDPI
jgi:alpha-tubulin suppressor-like RCC1 family protein